MPRNDTIPTLGEINKKMAERLEASVLQDDLRMERSAPGFFGFPAVEYSSGIEERLTALEKRVKDLEEAQAQARLHIELFTQEPLTRFRIPILGGLSKRGMKHIRAALRHLESGTEPTASELEEATS